MSKSTLLERSLCICWANQTFDLFADRAAYWREASSLIIADPHFGKAAAYRAAGVPVPEATTAANLERLSRLLQATAAGRLIILGDFLHARAGRIDATMNAIAQWREKYARIEIVLVRGNHDQHAGDPPREWNITCADEPLVEANLAFRHAPVDVQCESNVVQTPFSLAGHIHPCAVLRDLDGSSLRVAWIHVSHNQMILPAFGAFTGMHPIERGEGDRIFAAGPDSVVEMRTVVWK